MIKDMLNPTEAFDTLLKTGISERTVHLPLLRCIGKILVDDIICDHDLPPFDRVMMDGFAFKFKSLSARTEFIIIGEQRAGSTPLFINNEDECIEVMTGCILPMGCDTIIPKECTKVIEGKIQISAVSITEGQHIHRRGQDYLSGSTVVKSGCIIHSGHIGIAASCGYTSLHVKSLQSAVIISTGDELIDVSQKPILGQIRQSNSFVISSILNQLGIEHSNEHCPDNEQLLREKIRNHATQDLLILTGGLSMGKYDFVPSILESEGYDILFHKISQKPGKPMLVAKKCNQVVIAFPGNPVSVLSCACRYLLPLFRANYRKQSIKLGNVQYKKSNSLVCFQPVRLVQIDGQEPLAESVEWNGSGDFASMAQVNGFIEIPVSCDELPEKLNFFPLI